MKKKALLATLALLLNSFCFSVSAAQTEENLVAGMEYTVESGEPTTMSYDNYVENGVKFDEDKGQLTDGKFAPVSESSEIWYKAFRSQSRLITFDLKSNCAITRIKASFFHNRPSGVYAPRYINVYLSDDGVNYQTVKKCDTDFDLTVSKASRYEFETALDESYSARYVKIEFSSDIFTFCDEIEVLGSKTLSGNEKSVTPDAQTDPKGYFESLDGVSDVIKLYNGYYAPHPEKAVLTEEGLLPYVGYVDTTGLVKGMMFDAVAFVPCHGDYPSGGRLVKTNGKPGAVMSDWELYFDCTFKEGQDIEALDKVVGRVYAELGIKDKYKVFLTMPYPTVLDKPFGDIDGDGIAENCKTLEERTAIIKWFADKCINAFAEKNYKNLELAGFYWYREEVNYSDSDHEVELVKAFNEYAESKKLRTIFDPFYLSTGFDHWEELGFSSAVMQPNVAFTNKDYFEIGMLGEFAQSVYNNHLGVEIETNEPSYFRGDDYMTAGYNYESYLYYGAKTGYMNSFKTYYQGAGPGSFYDFCYADTKTPRGIYLRRLYDLTFNFIHGTYSNVAPKVTVGDMELTEGDSRGMVDIVIDDADSYGGDIKIEFPSEPKNGSVTAAANKKSLIYRAYRGFVGEDSFTVVVTDGFNRSEEITVNVKVLPLETSGEETDTESESSLDNTVTEPADDKGMPIWLIALLAALGLAIVAVAAVMIFKHKK
ncbi:MAG: DUF4855 domain-containing protein [Clostridia bacterium]|nr:DUF4855 domain-containing protein [Clostridia bacterium]